jgi:hypothetical protein
VGLSSRALNVTTCIHPVPRLRKTRGRLPNPLYLRDVHTDNFTLFWNRLHPVSLSNIILKPQILIHLNIVIVKLASPTIFGTTWTTTAETFFLKINDETRCFLSHLVNLLWSRIACNLPKFFYSPLTICCDFCLCICITLKDTFFRRCVFEALTAVAVKIFLRVLYSWFTLLMLVVLIFGSN